MKPPYVFCFIATLCSCILSAFFILSALSLQNPSPPEIEETIPYTPLFSSGATKKTLWSQRNPYPKGVLSAGHLDCFLEKTGNRSYCKEHLHQVHLDLFTEKNPHTFTLKQAFSSFAVYSFEDKSLFFPEVTLFSYDAPVKKDQPLQIWKAENASAFLQEDIEIIAPKLQVLQ
ncbi:MAG: hypothetical protein AAGI90_03045 [Chlamydiota bacterium]